MQVQIKRVEQLIEEFQNADVFDLALLMESARFLACQQYPFSQAVGEAKRLYNEAHVARRLKFAELSARIKETQKTGVAESQRLAEIDPEFITIYKREYELDAKFIKGKLMLDAMGEVLNRMNQEIAELRAEKKSYSNQSV